MASLTSSTNSMTTLGTVVKEDSTMDSNLFKQVLPTSASYDQIVIDVFGAGRTISISGIYSASTNNEYNLSAGIWAGYDDEQKILANRACFIRELDALISGTQQKFTYTSDCGFGSSNTAINPKPPLAGTRQYSVYIESVSWDCDPGSITMLRYRISMVESTMVTI